MRKQGWVWRMRNYILSLYERGDGDKIVAITSPDDPVEEIPMVYKLNVVDQAGDGAYTEHTEEYHYIEHRTITPSKTVKEWCKEFNLI